jgi:hypothetical protein
MVVERPADDAGAGEHEEKVPTSPPPLTRVPEGMSLFQIFSEERFTSEAKLEFLREHALTLEQLAEIQRYLEGEDGRLMSLVEDMQSQLLAQRRWDRSHKKE